MLHTALPSALPYTAGGMFRTRDSWAVPVPHAMCDVLHDGPHDVLYVHMYIHIYMGADPRMPQLGGLVSPRPRILYAARCLRVALDELKLEGVGLLQVGEVLLQLRLATGANARTLPSLGNPPNTDDCWRAKCHHKRKKKVN